MTIIYSAQYGWDFSCNAAFRFEKDEAKWESRGELQEIKDLWGEKRETKEDHRRRDMMTEYKGLLWRER